MRHWLEEVIRNHAGQIMTTKEVAEIYRKRPAAVRKAFEKYLGHPQMRLVGSRRTGFWLIKPLESQSAWELPSVLR